MSAPRTSTTVSDQDWREMNDLFRGISANLTTMRTDELERFTDVFVRTLKENEALQGDLSHCECR